MLKNYNVFQKCASANVAEGARLDISAMDCGEGDMRRPLLMFVYLIHILIQLVQLPYFSVTQDMKKRIKD